VHDWVRYTGINVSVAAVSRLFDCLSYAVVSDSVRYYHAD